MTILSQVYSGHDTADVLITRIRPQGMDRVQVEAVGYDERIYADDDGVPG